MKTLSCALVLSLCFIATTSHARTIAPVDPPASEQPLMQIALLLDTSNSMDGLIHQAKAHLWTIVNRCAATKRNGQFPQFQVALFEYGNNNLPAAEGYIRQVVPLTSDIDTLSQALFALTTNGGVEYCGQVIEQAMVRLAWHPDRDTYKAIFIAGNEPFTQGTIAYESACQSAKAQHVIVNTIHCGPHETGIAGMWRHGALLANGCYTHIDQNRVLRDIVAPQDERLEQLNKELNSTYLWYGRNAGEHAARQMAQDDNARTVSSTTSMQRIIVKSKRVYDNRDKDLVDAIDTNPKILHELADSELPETMQSMSETERRDYIKQQTEKRAAIQAEIQTLSAERQHYIAQKQIEETEKGENTLGDAILQALTEQLQNAGFEPDNK